MELEDSRMTRRFLISIVADNRTGVLPAIIGAIHELGGDMQEISQTVMQGVLSMALAVDFPELRDPGVVVDHLKGVARPFNAEVTIRHPHPHEYESNGEEMERFFLTLHGDDSPGLIRQITFRLAAEGIEITDLYAVREGVGGPVVMIFELAIPQQVDLGPLRGDLETLGDPTGLTVVLEHGDNFANHNFPAPVRLAKVTGAHAIEHADEL